MNPKDYQPSDADYLGLVLWDSFMLWARQLPQDELQQIAAAHTFEQCPDPGNPCPECAAALVVEERFASHSNP